MGLTLTRRLVELDYRLILTAREASLPRFAEQGIIESDDVLIRPLDITSAAQRRKVVQEAVERWGGVDILVNNAGVAYRSVVEHATDEDWMNQLNVNFRAPMQLIRELLPYMRERRDGRIINVSSVSGMMAMPTMALYSASKFALEGATESLWHEVRPWNIKVSLVQPGFIRSDSFRNTQFTAESSAAFRNAEDPYHAHYIHMDGFIARFMQRAAATPDTVARKMVALMRHPNPPLRSAATIDAQFFGMLRRYLPRRIYQWILYRSLPSVRKWGP